MKFNRNIITFCLALNIIVALSSGVAITTEGPEVNQVEGDPELEAYLREAIENFREQMRDGIDAIHMPVLDPLVLKHLDINVNEDAATVDLRIHEMSLNGLANFNLPHLEANLEELYISLTLRIPFLFVDGNYNLSCMVYKIFPIRGYGPFYLSVTDATIGGTGQLGFIEQDLVQMTSLELELQWRNMTMDLGNFLGGGRLQKVLQDAIPGFGKEVFQGFKPQILQHLNEAVMRKVNEELQNPKIRKIVSGILQEV